MLRCDGRRSTLVPGHACSGKPCPHCRRQVRLSPLSRHFLWQSHFSATVWTGLYIIITPNLYVTPTHVQPMELNLLHSCRSAVRPRSNFRMSLYDHAGDGIEYLLQLIGHRLWRPRIECITVVHKWRHESVLKKLFCHNSARVCENTVASAT